MNYRKKPLEMGSLPKNTKFRDVIAFPFKIRLKFMSFCHLTAPLLQADS